jgi:hypothetical protein
MLHAVILAKISGLEAAPLEGVRRLSGFEDGFYAFGRYDLIIFIRGTDFEQLQNIVRQINQTRGILKTETLTETT